MCIKHYVGYGCGHQDPEGTPLDTTYCPPPFRYHHEPPANPRDSEFCPTCRAIRVTLWQEWSAKYARWSHERLLPVTEQLSTHQKIQANFKSVALRAQQVAKAEGGDHTAHLLYRPGQNRILEPLDEYIKQVQCLRAASTEWESRITAAKQNGKVSKVFLDILTIKRRAQANVTQPVRRSVDAFLGLQLELLEELEKEEEKADAKEKADAEKKKKDENEDETPLLQ
ncbi:hypothetical protein PG995_008154 [Apiospora arundinis]